jgi:hypothetical protein
LLQDAAGSGVNFDFRFLGHKRIGALRLAHASTLLLRHNPFQILRPILKRI